MNRRGFFSKIFGRRRMADVSFFGVQVIIGSYWEDELRSKIHHIIQNGPEEESPSEKRTFYKKIAAVLTEALPAVEYGYWDYITNSGKAEAEFQGWTNEIEASMATEEEETGESIEESNRISGEKNYIAVTMLFLLEGADSNEDVVGIIDSLAEDQYFDRETFKKLIDAVNYIDFEFSFADACFIMPGNEEDGLSFEDIHGEGWEYLKPIM
jgi:hypothetical protein